MPGQNFLFVILGISIAGIWMVFRRKRVKREKQSATEDRLLWVGLAAGLFDSADSPPSSRLEIALAAIARKLGLRASLVTLHGRDRCQVIATSGVEQELLCGLEKGSVIARDSIYCGSLRTSGQSLAIDYASLSEWRRHPGFRERGWESYLAVNCGLAQGEDIVVSFFDSRPRGTLFKRSEYLLVEQLAPWIATMVEESGIKGREISLSLPAAELSTTN